MIRRIRKQPISASHGRSIACLLHFFLTSRPYSFPDNVARALLVCALVGVSSNLRLVFESIVLSLTMWCFLNWSSDARQRDAGRIVPSRWLTWTPFVVTSAVVAARGITPLIMLVGYLATIIAYPWKARVPCIGVFGPVLRGATIVGHLLFILSYLGHDHVDPSRFAFLFLALTLLHVGRNLVGDIRDILTDRYELPARFGFRPALWTLRGIFAAVAVTIFFLLPAQQIAVGGPLILQWALIELLAFLWGEQRPELVGYLGHRLYVLTFTTSELLLAHQFGAPSAICLTIAGAAVLLQVFYRYVPGKKYPQLSECILALRVWTRHSVILLRCLGFRRMEGRWGLVPDGFVTHRPTSVP
jgi:hypothetical protein